MTDSVSCKAIIQQGPRKGLKCLMTDLKNEYCWKHQRNYEYDTHITNGNTPCNMFFRGCNTLLITKHLLNNLKRCDECREKKKENKIHCKHIGCTNNIKTEKQKYCRIHQRDLLKDDEETRGIKYCNIARGCFNILDNTNTKCNECIAKFKTNIANDIQSLRQIHNIHINVSTNELALKQEDKLIEIHELWRGLQRNAYARELMITITREEFEKMAIKPCYYCGFVSTIRLNGVDRIDNNKGYLSSNCIPCCKMCNMMKQTQHPIEFLDKISAIVNYIKHGIAISPDLINKWKTTYLTNKRERKYNEYKNKAINYRHKIFELTEEEFNTLHTFPCYLCGISSSSEHINGIDRYNTELGYILSNCRSCCTHCNIIKGQYSFIDLYNKCEQILLHNCNKELFINLEARSKRCDIRNEFYTANTIIDFMDTNKFDNYIEWCKEKLKSDIYISEINNIYTKYLSKEITKTDAISRLQHSLEKERTSKTNNTQNKKYNASTIYSIITVSGINKFKEWYNSQYTQSNSFEKLLDTLSTQLEGVDKEVGTELCRKFMEAEKNRRNNQKLRDKSKKIYTNLDDIIHNNVTSNTTIQNTFIDVPINTISPQPSKQLKELPHHIQSTLEILKEKPIPKQWKVLQIYKCIKENKTTPYKEWCEQTNELSGDAWETMFAKLLTDIQPIETLELAEPIIRAFIEELRRLRHNKIVNEYNDTRNPIDREDRQVWTAATILKAYKKNQLDIFKIWLNEQDDDVDEPATIARWEKLIEQLSSDISDKEKQGIISKFLTARRARKYRASLQLT